MVERKHQVTCADEGCLKQEKIVYNHVGTMKRKFGEILDRVIKLFERKQKRA